MLFDQVDKGHMSPKNNYDLNMVKVLDSQKPFSNARQGRSPLFQQIHQAMNKSPVPSKTQNYSKHNQFKSQFKQPSRIASPINLELGQEIRNNIEHVVISTQVSAKPTNRSD